MGLILEGSKTTQKVADALEDKARQLRDYYPAFVETEKVIMRSFRARVNTGAGGAWASLEPVYGARKLREGYSRKIMKRTGAFAKAANQARKYILGHGKDWVVFGFDGGLKMAYPFILQAGSAYFPARSIMEWYAPAQKALLANIAAHMEEPPNAAPSKRRLFGSLPRGVR
jgi:hypothetical protein